MKNVLVMLFFIVSFISPLSAKALHLVMMGDTEDKKIYTGSIKNLMNIEQSFSYLSSVTQVPLHLTKLTTTDNTLTRNKIMRWIRNTSVAHDDIIIIYYAGHGWRKQENKTIFPSGYFFNEKRPDNFLDFSEVIKRLFSKKAALNIVLLDCCNVLYAKDLQTNIPSLTFEMKGLNDQLVARGFQELFKQKGLIIASGASPEEVGWCNNFKTNPIRYDDSLIAANSELGGIFTKSFLNNFFTEIQSMEPKWSHILEKTKNECCEETKKEKYKKAPNDDFKTPHDFQTPQYKIYLHKHRKSPTTYRKYLFYDSLSKKMEKNSIPFNDASDNLEEGIVGDLDISSLILLPGLPS